MARIRTIKPSAFTSESLANCSIAAGWTFAGLWTYLDDEGRGKADARLIKGQLWPLRDEVSPADVSGHLDELEREECVCRYFVGTREYIHVVNWDHQSISKPTPSKIPPCPKGHHSGSTPGFPGGTHGDSGETQGYRGEVGESGVDEGPGDDKGAGGNGVSLFSGETQGDPGEPGERHAGTGNREQGSGTGNREQGTRGARESQELADFVTALVDSWVKARRANRHTPTRKQQGELQGRILEALESHPRDLVAQAVENLGHNGYTRVDYAIADLTSKRKPTGHQQATSERNHLHLESLKDPDPGTDRALGATPGGF